MQQTLFDVVGGRAHDAVQHRGGMFGQTGEVENAFDRPVIGSWIGAPEHEYA